MKALTFPDITRAWDWLRQNASGDCSFRVYHSPKREMFRCTFTYIHDADPQRAVLERPQTPRRSQTQRLNALAVTERAQLTSRALGAPLPRNPSPRRLTP